MYRRRRLVALLIVLLVVAGIAWGVTTLLGGGQQADAVPAGPSTEEPSSAPATPGEVVPCSAADLSTSLALDPPAPVAGEGLTLDVTVRNDGELPCLLDAGPGSLVASVSSGSDPVWSSAHCAGDASKELLLDTDTETSVAVPWNGSRSAEGCPGEQDRAGAGTYRVSLALAGEPLEENRVFTLE